MAVAAAALAAIGVLAERGAIPPEVGVLAEVLAGPPPAAE